MNAEIIQKGNSKELGRQPGRGSLKAGRKLKHRKSAPSAFAKVIKFYSDVSVGTTGEIIDHWFEKKHGTEWFKLYFGKNISGQKLIKSFPADVLEKIIQ